MLKSLEICFFRIIIVQKKQLYKFLIRIIILELTDLVKFYL